MRFSRPSVRLSVQASCLSSSVLPPLLPECRPAEFFPWEGLTTVIAVEVLSPWHPSYSIDRVPPSFRTEASRSGALVFFTDGRIINFVDILCVSVSHN